MLPSLVPIWIISSILIGFFGRHLRFGFWGYFFASILLTPVIGILMLIAAIPKRPPSPARKREGRV